MKRLSPLPFLTLLLLLAAGCTSARTGTPPALQVSPPAGMQVVDGKLGNQISRLEKDMPRAGSQGFIVPTEAEMQAFFSLVTDLRSGNLEQALAASSTHGYELLWYTDQNDENALDYVLRPADPSRGGWGLYILRIGSTSNVILEAPHPIYDEGTPNLAMDIFRAIDARALLVAGAHRDANDDGSADASMVAQSIFQAVHESELEQSIQAAGSAIILQVHGFSSSKHPAYPHVIINAEQGNNLNPVDLLKGQQLAARLVAALKDKGVQAGLCDGVQWRDLCGTKNIQAALMTEGIFIHIELDETIRGNDKKLIEVLSLIFGN